jgi:hypothetical protein
MTPEIIAIEIQNMRIEIPCREELLQTLARVVGNTPTHATVSTVPVPNPPAAQPAPIPTVPEPAPAPVGAIPTAPPSNYTHQQLIQAAVPLMDAGKLNELAAFLADLGAQTVDQLPPEALGLFAAKLRQMGANI